MKFDRSNKFDFCYYGQANSLRLKSSVGAIFNTRITLYNSIHEQFKAPILLILFVRITHVSRKSCLPQLPT